MRSDAEARRATIVGEAESAITELTKSSNEEIARNRESALARLDRELQVLERALRDEASLAVQSRTLAGRDALIDEAFSTARQRLQSLSTQGPDGRSLGELAVNAVNALDTGSGETVTVTVSPELEAVVASALKQAGIDASVRKTDTDGTIRATTGDRTVDNSPIRRLERARSRLVPLLGRMLFEGSGDGRSGV